MFEIILLNFNDRHFAFGVLRRIRRVRGVDHNGLTEFSADRTRWRFGWIGRAEHIANLAYRVHALINNRNRFFCPRSIALVWRAFAGFSARHEFDDALPIFATAFWTELFVKDWQHRAVKLFRLRHAHLMNLEADDGKARARKYFNDTAWPQIWKPEIVRFDQY